jgi:hypothetical protein
MWPYRSLQPAKVCFNGKRRAFSLKFVFVVLIAISSTRLAFYIVSQRRQKDAEDQKERDTAKQAAQKTEDEKVSFLAFIMHVCTLLFFF